MQITFVHVRMVAVGHAFEIYSINMGFQFLQAALPSVFSITT